jgi:hypothetical protein
LSDVILSGNANWSTCKAGGPPAASDNVYLGSGGTTGFVLTLDGAKNATYTCSGIYAMNGNDKTTWNTGTISILSGASPGPTINADLYAGTNTALGYLMTIPAGTYVNSIKSITGAVTGSSTTYGVYIASTGTLTTCTLCTGGTSGNYGLTLSTNSTVGTITNCVAGQGPAAYGCSCGGTITTVASAAGGNSSGCVGLYVTSAGTVTTLTAVSGGNGANAFGVWNLGIISNIGIAKGGSDITAYGLSHTTITGMTVVSSVDNTGVAPPLGIGICRLPLGVRIGTVDIAQTGSMSFVEQSGIAYNSNAKSGIPRYTGASGDNFGTYPLNNESYTVSING